MGLLEDKIPTAVSDFRRFLNGSEFKIDDEDDHSASAYRLDEIDVLIDFNFELLRRANNVVRFAARKLEMEGHSLPEMEEILELSGANEGSLSHEKQPDSDLLHPLQNSSKSLKLDAKLLRNARIKLGVTQAAAAQWFQVTERQYKRWESGKQSGVHMTNFPRIKCFINWAKQNSGLPPHVP